MSYRRLLAAEILSRWPELVLSEMENISHDSQHGLAELLVERYGFCRDRAEREAAYLLADFADRLRRDTAA